MLGLVLCTGCGPLRSRDPVPQTQLNAAQIRGLPSWIRTWGDNVDSVFEEQCFGVGIEQRREYYNAHPEDPHPPTFDILCISGGGEEGAFGAGLLTGWTQRGDRPKFMMVTGISTGALSAPMAFLGKPYDQKLKDAYTNVTRHDIFELRPIFSILGSDSLTDNTPMVKLIERYVDERMLQEIAREHLRGRRLLIGTTNLDAQRPVIWDMGAIAASDYPHKLELFRNIMLASAAVPGIFPPVYLKVEANGKRYDEMHVDGGTTAQVFLWGQGVDMEQIRKRHEVQNVRPTRIFVIRNSKLYPEWDVTDAWLPDIASRSVATLIKSQGRGDVLRLYATAQWYGFDFNLASIPESFTEKLKDPFDRKYMNDLYQVGYELGKQGYHWEKSPPREIRRLVSPTTMPMNGATTVPATQPVQ